MLKKLWGPKKLTQNFVWHKIYVDVNFLQPKLFWTQHFSDQIFFENKIYLGPKLFGTQNLFWTPNLFDLESFWDPKIFLLEPTIFWDPKFCGLKFVWNPKSFCTQNALENGVWLCCWPNLFPYEIQLKVMFGGLVVELGFWKHLNKWQGWAMVECQFFRKDWSRKLSNSRLSL